MSATIRAVAYVRMSTGKQEASIPEQLNWIGSEAKRQSLSVLATFDDPGIPGDEIRHRPGLQALLEYCRRQYESGTPIDTIVCWKLDRLSRADSFATAVIMGQLMAHGVKRCLDLEGWMRLDDDGDRVIFNLKQDMNRRAYAKNIAENVTRGYLEGALRGQWMPGKVPYGYRRGPGKKLIVCEDEARWVEWIFRQYISRPVGTMTLAAELNEMGAPTPIYSTGVWKTDTLCNILANEHYTGVMLWNATRRGKYARVIGGQIKPAAKELSRSGKIANRRNNPEDVVRIPDSHPALIDRETWAAVQLKMDRQRPAKGRPKATITIGYPLSGLLYCSECGRPMRGHTIVKKTPKARRTWKKYICGSHKDKGKAGCRHNAALESELLVAVAEALHLHFATPKNVEALRARLRKRVGQQDKDGKKLVAELEKKAKELDAKIEAGTARLLEISKEFLADAEAQLRKRKAEREDLQTRLDAARHHAAQAGRDEAKIDKALKALQKLPELILSDDPAKLGETLRGLIARVDLNFAHQVRGSKTYNTCTGGMIEFRPDVGAPVSFAFREVAEPEPVSSNAAVTVATTEAKDTVFRIPFAMRGRSKSA